MQVWKSRENENEEKHRSHDVLYQREIAPYQGEIAPYQREMFTSQTDGTSYQPIFLRNRHYSGKDFNFFVYHNLFLWIPHI